MKPYLQLHHFSVVVCNRIICLMIYDLLEGKITPSPANTLLPHPGTVLVSDEVFPTALPDEQKSKVKKTPRVALVPVYYLVCFLFQGSDPTATFPLTSPPQPATRRSQWQPVGRHTLLVI